MHWSGLINSCCKLHFPTVSIERDANAFCHAFSRKFHNMRIFSRKKYVFDVFRLSKKAAVNVLQASRKHEKKIRFGV